MISLSRKAGKLIYGFDVVKDSVLTEQAKLVIFSADISQKTKQSMVKIITDNKELEYRDTPLIMHDYAVICGKPTGVLAITDSGFATAIIKLLQEDERLYDRKEY